MIRFHKIVASCEIKSGCQVWKDVRANEAKEPARGIMDDSALPRTSKQPIDVDLPAMGQFYCVETGKYFINQRALDDHKKSRFYKMRVKQLKGAAPHSRRDAEMAAGKTYLQVLVCKHLRDLLSASDRARSRSRTQAGSGSPSQGSGGHGN